jgi:hypothetical protein
MKPLRVRVGKYARAFVSSSTMRQSLVLWLRGWRRHCNSEYLWMKPNIHQKHLDKVNGA